MFFGPHLNEYQRAFCTTQTSSIRLIAPAGCGKTHSLLWRCLYLAQQSKAEVPRFLILTFTRAAADELNDRLRNDVAFSEILHLVTVTTLNAWGFKRLKNLKHNLQLKTSKKDKYFTLNNILQPVWMKHPLLKQILTESRGKQYASNVIMDLIDLLKTLGFRHDRIKSKEDFKNHVGIIDQLGMELQIRRLLLQLADLGLIRGASDPLGEAYGGFYKFWRQATEQLYNSSIISLEDQKYWPWFDLDEQVEKKSFWTGVTRYHHILVDEFQDINPLDLGLIKTIAAINRSEVTILGDDDQAIYEWRAATPDFILNPEKHLGAPYTTIILGTNYRSPKNIVELSQKLISHNQRRVQKEVHASSTFSAKIEVLEVSSLAESVEYVLDLVASLNHREPNKRIAIIGRKRSQIIPYQIIFAGQDIPFYAAEDLHLFLSESFEELKAFLAIRARADMGRLPGTSPINDLLVLCDKVKRYKFSKADREALRDYLIRANSSNLREAVSDLLQYKGGLKGQNADGKASRVFATKINGLLNAKSVAECIWAIGEFEGFKKDYGKSVDDIFYADPPFTHLAEYAQRYSDDFNAFDYDMSKAIGSLARIPPEEEGDDKNHDWKLPLHLMTALRTKGKEFNTVIILDANESIWPSKLAESEYEQEAERRVFYVAMTRAKEHLVFLVNRSILNRSVKPSRYLAEMRLVPKPL